MKLLIDECLHTSLVDAVLEVEIVAGTVRCREYSLPLA